MENSFEKTVLKVDARRFIPFREGNVLRSHQVEFHLDDASLRIDVVSAFWPFMAEVTQAILEPAAFTEMQWLKRIATGFGYQELAEGKTDLLIGNDGNEILNHKLDQTGLPIIKEKIWMEPIAILLNKENPVKNLTVSQIQDIYFGRISNWSEVGGANLPIHTYQLERGNGSQTAFEKIVRGNKFDDYHHEVHTMPDIIDDVAKDNAGICYAFWSYYTRMYANTQTRMINVDGRVVTDPHYPLQDELYMIYRKDHPNANLHRLTSWLKSTEGQELIAACYQPERTVE
jgi:phosphate transport system substrate-binding protein